MSKNAKMIGGSLVIAVAILFLLIAATPGSSGVELKLAELLKDQQEYTDDYVTVEGLLIEDSIKWDADKIQLKFDVQDENGKKLSVIYNGVKPDNFSEGVITILQGSPDEEKAGLFHAETVKTRCPSKYEGEDMKNYDPEAHKDKLNKKSEEETK
ncbi:MAG: hypothetical protein K0S51_1367 [Bacillales bacterium]|jgi:cytochrome c-type biogenesis protein CcmE|nr:hypothetical protein [Bacillales bacterium]